MFFELPTEQCVGETVPPAPGASCQPLAAQAGRKAERSPEDGDQHVAGADVDEQQVHGSVQPGEAREHQEHEEVPEEAQHEDESEGDGNGGVTRPGEGVTGGLCRCAVAAAEVVAALEEICHDGPGCHRWLPQVRKTKILLFECNSDWIKRSLLNSGYLRNLWTGPHLPVTRETNEN